jgi:transcription elongation factor Elf1
MSLHIDTKFLRMISHKVRNFKQKDTYLFNMSCPYCGDSQKNKTKARGYFFKKGNDLIYKCHNCGVGVNIANFLKHIDAGIHKEYVLERYKAGESGVSNFKQPEFNIPTPKFGKLKKQPVFEYGEWLNRLPSGHFCLEYATKRQIPNKFYDKLLFTSHYNQFITTLVPNHGKQINDDARLVIPFYNEYNELIAVSGRALETSDKTLRYVTIRTNDSVDKLIYGMDRVDLSKTVKIVEGPIDSLFLDNCLASGDANLSLTAKMIDPEKKVLIFDREPRNKQIVKMMQDAIKLNYNVVIWPNNIQGKDINEMIMNGISSTEIESIISSNTFKGLEAQLKFNFWKKV